MTILGFSLKKASIPTFHCLKSKDLKIFIREISYMYRPFLNVFRTYRASSLQLCSERKSSGLHAGNKISKEADKVKTKEATSFGRLYGAFKETLQKYGRLAVGIHLSVFAATCVGFYSVLSIGFDGQMYLAMLQDHFPSLKVLSCSFFMRKKLTLTLSWWPN